MRRGRDLNPRGPEGPRAFSSRDSRPAPWSGLGYPGSYLVSARFVLGFLERDKSVTGVLAFSPLLVDDVGD